ncbi:MAG: SHOCT domain-containing protein [Microbacteriaceae bacterium]|nr:MAG: SHOCT domain-containing protein [Microbacteriaceae bacterium]
MLGGILALSLTMGALAGGSVGLLPAGIVVAIVVGGFCVYMLRGRGPTTADVETRLAAERKEAKAKRRKANFWGVVAGAERLIRPRASGTPSSESAAAAQVDALSDPQTAKALQELQKLLYTLAITDQEFAAAKQKLVGDPGDDFAQIRKLAELHEAGILGDVEFAAAKARALGL